MDSGEVAAAPAPDVPSTQTPNPLPSQAVQASPFDTLVTVSSLASAPPVAGTSPGALLAASLVRSRASYFERISSGSRASTSGSGHLCGAPAQSHAPGSRLAQSTPLPSHPLHPLAPHPLCTLNRTGSGELRRQRDEDLDAGCDSDMETESVDTFFDKPSYTRYGSNVELSAASAYRDKHVAAASAGGSMASEPTESPINSGGTSGVADTDGGGGEQATTGADGNAAACGSKAAEQPAVNRKGYVRSMSARFGSMAGGSGAASGRGASGTDGLFDDLVAHVGALLASNPDVEAQMGMVQGLSDRLLELHALCEMLGRKEDEVEHLRGVLRELTMTRAEAIRLKVQMAESLNGLQQEYYKVLRSAQMAQGTCKQHSLRAAATRKQLAEAQAELGRYKRAVAVLRDRNRRLSADNKDMKTRLQALEQVSMGSDIRRSACYVAIVQSQTAVLY